MCYTGLFKRIIPFVLTFAAGLFIASFFVSVTAPSFGNWRESRRGRHRDKQQLLLQIDQLREEKRALQVENERLKQQATDSAEINAWVPPIEIEHPPAPPKRPKNPGRTDILR